MTNDTNSKRAQYTKINYIEPQNHAAKLYIRQTEKKTKKKLKFKFKFKPTHSTKSNNEK